MPVIYMIPFGLISAAAGLVCLIVPRWRRYAFAAVVSPIAFGGCSIVGMFTAILLADVLGLPHDSVWTELWIQRAGA